MVKNCNSTIEITFEPDQYVIVQDTNGMNFTLEMTQDTSVEISDLESLHLTYSRYGVRPVISIENVKLVKIIDENTIIDWIGVTHEQLYLYLSIALASISFICLFVIIPSIICCKSKESCSTCVSSGTQDKKSKRVERAESWRFDSSMYINPRNASRARMTTQPLPYQLVSQRDTLVNPSQGQNPHIAQMLGRTTQVS